MGKYVHNHMQHLDMNDAEDAASMLQETKQRLEERVLQLEFDASNQAQKAHHMQEAIRSLERDLTKAKRELQSSQEDIERSDPSCAMISIKRGLLIIMHLLQVYSG